MELAFHFYVSMIYPLPDLHPATTAPKILRRRFPFDIGFISALLGFKDNFLVLLFLYRSYGCIVVSSSFSVSDLARTLKRLTLTYMHFVADSPFIGRIQKALSVLCVDRSHVGPCTHSKYLREEA